jgi:DEAD/DEAH box helicase domain-containing protein
MRRTMSTLEDLAGTVFNTKNEFGEIKKSHILLYDSYPGGLGFSEKAYDFSREILDEAIALVQKCGCKDGCPACVGDYHLDKKLVHWGLKCMVEKSEAPIDIKKPEKAPKVIVEYICKLSELPARWAEFVNYLRSQGEYLNSFLSTIENVEVQGNMLIFLTDYHFYEEWIMDGSNKSRLINVIKRYVETPKGFDIAVKTMSKEKNELKEKIMRRYDDLVK